VTDTPTQRDDEGAWAKLLRRKVVQWGLTYAAGAWALLQVWGFAADAFHWPDVAKQIAMLALAIGLPIVLTLAWYHGDRGEQRATGAELAILTLLLFLGGGGLWLYEHRSVPTSGAVTTTTSAPAPTAPTSDARPSIAVLPFVNMSPEKNQEYFSDGLSEQMLDLLAKVPQLRVMARTSSFSFKGKDADAATIARTLGVAHLLEGSVRKSGDHLRISAKLVRASDSSQLWSETYDRKLEDIFKVQDEIAEAVVKQLRIRMLGSSLPASQATDPEAYADYLRARQLYQARTQDSLAQATVLLERALAVDGKYGPAWQLLGRTFAEQAWVGFLPLHEGYAKARAALQRAVDIDPLDASAIAALASLSKDYDINLSETARLLKRALALSPNNAAALKVAGFMALSLADSQRAIAIFEELARLDPVNSLAWADLGYAYLMFGRYDDSIAAVQKSLELAPNAVFRHFNLSAAKLLKGEVDAALAEIQLEPHDVIRNVGLSLVYATTGKREESHRLLEETGREHPEFALVIATGYARLGETDRSFEWLERGLRERDGAVADARVDPFLKPLRTDPRWQPLLGKVGVSDEQIKALDFNIEVPLLVGSSGGTTRQP
jgi:TolB-like protein/cytochrome c-type biogenesis protein CcmH/NrfG